MRIGLVLGGGGARGSFQLGIIKALHEEKLIEKISYCSGTSIGAINTAFLLMGMSTSDMIKTWKEMNNSILFASGPERLYEDKLGVFSIKSVYDRISYVITDKHLDNLRESPINGYVTTCLVPKNMLTIGQINSFRLKKRVFNLNTAQNPIDYMLASASIPYFFGSLEVDGEYYVDGGVLDNLPIEPIANFCDVIIVAPNFQGSYKKIEKYYLNSDKLVIDLTPRFLFNPILAGFEIVNFSPKEVVVNALYGYRLAKMMFNELREKNVLNENSEFVKKDTYEKIQVDKKLELEMSKSVKNHFKH
ncbi:MAG: patatin-like phospholipase family protein [Acholeplasmatales bacterium]|jgi:NTE family protein|nr:patatin-like phospholipase family protein [Acholeplasmatales bacterium]